MHDKQHEKQALRITVSVSDGLRSRLDAFRASCKRQFGVEVSLSEVARTLLENGLSEWEAAQKKARSKVR